MNETIIRCRTEQPPAGRIRAAIFDFDGTVSTLRQGWEAVMAPMMEEVLGGRRGDPVLRERIDRYIDSSTGIQTIYQMQWLEREVRERGGSTEPHDAWWYKEEYNRRLMEAIAHRIEAVRSGREPPERYMVAGAEAFLSLLSAGGARLFLASGTDHDDVCNEARVLGVGRYFEEIQGAPRREAACSKKAVIERLIREKGLAGDELALIGDGKVEIALGVEHGAYAVGIASDERSGRGIQPAKRERLVQAGAHVIAGDFLQARQLAGWLLHGQNP